MHLERSPSHGHTLCFQQSWPTRKIHITFLSKMCIWLQPHQSLHWGILGLESTLGKCWALASFRTKPVQAIRHWSVGVSEAQRLAGQQGAGTAVEKMRYTWQTCLVNVNCLTWQITTRDGQHRDLYNTPLANTSHTLLCTSYKESDPLAFYIFFGRSSPFAGLENQAAHSHTFPQWKVLCRKEGAGSCSSAGPQVTCLVFP